MKSHKVSMTTHIERFWQMQCILVQNVFWNKLRIWEYPLGW